MSAKLSRLDQEFKLVKEKSSDNFSWYQVLWEKRTVQARDWVLADAWYRSRCLELSNGRPAMVPCVDMANHSRNPTARYDTNDQDELVLSLRDNCGVSAGDEITIDYGEKSAAEMLFSYGFIDPDSASGSLVLPLEPLAGDPLAKAKLYSFGKAPTIAFRQDEEGGVRWTSPFAYFACLNEEDGLEFRVLQETGGAQQLRVFWGELDVADKVDAFEDLIQEHPLCDVFKLRVVSVLIDKVQDQLKRLANGVSTDMQDLVPTLLRKECVEAASELRARETGLLERALEVLSEEVRFYLSTWLIFALWCRLQERRPPLHVYAFFTKKAHNPFFERPYLRLSRACLGAVEAVSQ